LIQKKSAAIQKPKIVIIGGGVAGLKAALDLATKEVEVTLLEARDRLGGRIYTIKANNGRTPIELGASYWEGLNESEFYQRYLESKTMRLDEKASSVMTLDRPPEADNLLANYHDAQVMLVNAESTHAGSTFAQFVAEKKPSYWVNRFLENSLLHHCTPLDKGGFPLFKRQPVPVGDAWNEKDADFCFVKGGYNQVIEQLTKECKEAGVKISMSSTVTKILDMGINGVKVATQRTSFSANKVISTIPIGVLKNHAEKLFFPLLSKAKTDALSMIGIHDATRVIVEFEGEPFWDNKDGPYLYLDSKDSPCLLEFRNAYPLTGKAILITGKYSDVARKLYTQFPDNAAHAEKLLGERVLSDLRKAFPHKEIPDPIQTTVYCWTQDPFAQGAYPYRTAAITEEIQQALEQPEGNVYFAGADFSRYGFSVHNAYASGERVASEVYELVQIKSQT